MRYALLLFCLVLGSFSYAQTINDIPVAEINSTYIELLGRTKFMSAKVTIAVQFGQESKLFGADTQTIRDAEGKPVAFNSMVDALNFFDSVGYDFVNAYPITIGNQNVYHYLMRKRE